jgi:hypothetical protein
MDIDGVRTFLDLEVIEIVDNNCPYPVLLGIDWAFNHSTVVDLKKRRMKFEGDGLRFIAPMDPDEGRSYTESIREEYHSYDIDNIYKLTTRQQDYINPTTYGNLSWRSDSACSSDSKEALENWYKKMYEFFARRCARLTKEVHWIGTEVSNLPTFDCLNHLETFLLEFEEVVPVQHILLALDEALKFTPARWWGTHKKNITEWIQCRTLMTTQFSDNIEGCEVIYTGQSCPKDHVRGCEEAWSKIPQEQWVHKFINTLDTRPINWHLQAELCLTTSDWYSMTQIFIATFSFEIQYPSVDQSLKVFRHKVFEEGPSLPEEQEEDEWTAPLQKIQ